ncbi:MAG TPA: hypothetical protein VMH27_05675 [Puia sp.]|nr:hypothetical protein [Puia sp.]
MKRELLLLLTGTVVMALPACVKHLDVGELVQPEVKSCPILQMGLIDPDNPDTEYVEIVIHYNAAGNPTEMLHVKGDPPLDFQDYHFRYDRFNRLAGYSMNTTGSNSVLGWHTYTYPSRSMVVDSVYGKNAFEGVILHFLDNEGRIIEDQENGYGGSLKDTTIYFQYDAWGNMIRPLDYDNKFNPYLTNDVWRFIYEDYSVNNPLRENMGQFMMMPKYDSHGLPQIIECLGSVELFNYEFYPAMQIAYGCDEGQKGL